MDTSYRSRNVNLVSVLRFLLRDYGFEPIVKISVIDNPLRKDEKIIKVEPASLGMPAYYYLNITERHGVRVFSCDFVILQAFEFYAAP
jgi:hypothetical protein